MIRKSLGTTLSFLSGNTVVTVGCVKSISELKMDSDMIDTTTLEAEDGFRTFTQGAKNAGELTIEGYLNDDESSQDALRALYLAGTEAMFTIAFSEGQTAVFLALVKSVWLGAAEVDGVVGFGATLKLTGGVTMP